MRKSKKEAEACQIGRCGGGKACRSPKALARHERLDFEVMQSQ